MNPLDLPLSVILAGWLLRRISKRRTSRLVRLLPTAVLEATREAIGKMQEGLQIYSPSWLQRFCLWVQRKHIAAEEEAYRKLSMFDVWYLNDGGDIDE